MFKFDERKFVRELEKAVHKTAQAGFRREAPAMYAEGMKEQVADLLAQHSEQLKANPDDCVEVHVQEDLPKGYILDAGELMRLVAADFPEYNFELCGEFMGSPKFKITAKQAAS